jgi:hypothetical protein
LRLYSLTAPADSGRLFPPYRYRRHRVSPHSLARGCHT